MGEPSQTQGQGGGSAGGSGGGGRSQADRPLAVGTPLGDDVLLLRSFSGSEDLGRLYEYRLNMVSERADIPFQDIVGRNITIRVQMSPGEDPRYFNGYVASFSQGRSLGGLTEYSARMVPWIWLLTRTTDCKIFQQMTVPDIIQQVLRDAGFTDFENRLHGTYRTWEYCVQYRETSFGFISRLMEQEGIYYYFTHENGKHTLIFCDDASGHEEFPEYGEIQYRPPTRSVREREYIQEWRVAQEIQPGIYAHTDYNFTAPKRSLLTSSSIQRQHAQPNLEVFDYPGEFGETSEGEAYARRRIEEFQARHERCEGESDVRGIATGHKFSMTEHPRQDQNRDYLIVSTSIVASTGEYESGGQGHANYSCSFAAINLQQPFRSPRMTPKPVIEGPQTAMVVGPSGEEIYTDEYGRVKVQFHWDRYSQANENSSCWIRVSQPWAGKKWGSLWMPRIGQEVIVEFLEGDPDRPIITGRVYNADAMPPYELPANATMSTFKSNSSKGGSGFNEIRFEDKKGEEQIFIHGEKNQDTRIKNDSFEWIGNDRHLVVKRDQKEHVERDRDEKIDRDATVEIGKDLNVTVRGKEDKAVTKTLNLEVTGDVTEKFSSNHTEETTNSYSLKAMSISIEGSASITLKVGGSQISMNPGMIEIKAPMVKIN